MIKFVVAPIDKFATKSISTDSQRKSMDGTKCLKHIENLTAKELEAIRYDPSYQFVGDEDIYSLMETSEWKPIEIKPILEKPILTKISEVR